MNTKRSSIYIALIGVLILLAVLIPPASAVTYPSYSPPLPSNSLKPPNGLGAYFLVPDFNYFRDDCGYRQDNLAINWGWTHFDPIVYSTYEVVSTDWNFGDSECYPYSSSPTEHTGPLWEIEDYGFYSEYIYSNHVNHGFYVQGEAYHDYQVTLTVTDSLGHKVSITKPVRVTNVYYN